MHGLFLGPSGTGDRAGRVQPEWRQQSLFMGWARWQRLSQHLQWWGQREQPPHCWTEGQPGLRPQADHWCWWVAFTCFPLLMLLMLVSWFSVYPVCKEQVAVCCIRSRLQYVYEYILMPLRCFKVDCVLVHVSHLRIALLVWYCFCLSTVSHMLLVLFLPNRTMIVIWNHSSDIFSWFPESDQIKTTLKKGLSSTRSNVQSSEEGDDNEQQ